MEWRRKPRSDVWHWCHNCSQWPEKDYASTDAKPTTGEGCNQCRSKEAKENCQEN